MLINNQLMNLLNYSPDTHAKPTRMRVFGWVPYVTPVFGTGAHPNIRLYGLQHQLMYRLDKFCILRRNREAYLE